MVCEPQDIPGCPGLQAHRGMVLSASNIITILETDGVLDKAFSLYPVCTKIVCELLLLVASFLQVGFLEKFYTYNSQHSIFADYIVIMNKLLFLLNK